MNKSIFGLIAALTVASAAQTAGMDARDVDPPKGKVFVNQKGEPVICRSWRDTGSKIRKTSCGTAREWKQADRD